MTSELHFEQQDGNLCAQHAINALLQGHYFTAVDLADIAHRLDAAEAAAMDGNTIATSERSQNMDDSGYFSVQVISEAISDFAGLELLNWNHPNVSTVRHEPCLGRAFICNQQKHWFTIRRVGENWFNLNSMLSRPQYISPTLLSLTLAQLENEGYTIFVVVGDLPDSEADTFGVDPSQYPPSSDKPTATKSKSMLSQDDDSELRAAIAASLGLPPEQSVSPPLESTSTAVRVSAAEHDLNDRTLQQALAQSAAEHSNDDDDPEQMMLEAALAESLRHNNTSQQQHIQNDRTDLSSTTSRMPLQGRPSADELRSRRAAFLDRMQQQQ